MYSPFHIVLDRLGVFWESEAPRAGEPEALGWAAWEGAGCPDSVSGPSRVMPRSPKVADPYVRWAAAESDQDQNLYLPARSSEECTNDDPYSVILFSDLRPLLVNLTCPGAKQAFRLLWLSFLGLHIPGFAVTLSSDPSGYTDDRWCANHLTTPALMDALFPQELATRRITADSHSGVLVGRERFHPQPFSPVKYWTFDVLDPLAGVANGKYMMWTRADVDFPNPTVIREVFQQCRLPGKDAAWDILRLAFEGAMDLKSYVLIYPLK